MADTVRLTVSAAAFRAGLLLAGWLAISFQTRPAEPSPVSIRWNTNSNQMAVEVVGISEKALRHLRSTNWQSDDWQKLLSVYAGQGDFMADMNVPAVVGSYSLRDLVIRFEPKFPWQPGVTYRAVFRPERLPAMADKVSAQIVSKFSLPTAPHNPTTIVSQIYPSNDVLPENLLKFYVHFSAPMQGGHIYDHIHLRDEAGKSVELPFLEIDEELWNPDMMRLTLFIDPGRIKRGVKPLEEIGPALEEGKRYTLEIDATWLDSAGMPLRESFRKTFRVGAPDREPPSLATWKISAPKAGAREALTVEFPEPMDHALALRLIRVASPAGELVKGTSALSDRELRWSFIPQESWTAGHYQLHVQNTIEDLAGNNIGKVFEVDLFEGVQPRFTNAVVKVPFEVR
jgi:hypothetical protein